MNSRSEKLAGNDKGSNLNVQDYTLGYNQGRRDMAHELAESGGLAQSQLGLQILYQLPDEFVRAYGMVWEMAFGDEGLGSRRITEDSQTDKRKKKLKDIRFKTEEGVNGYEPGAVGNITGGGKKWTPSKDIVRSDKYLKLKVAVDKELNTLTRRIMNMERGTLKPQTPRCPKAGCGKFVNAQWVYCASCGTRLKYT